MGFQSLQESIDTTTSGGRLIFHIFGALAEFERNLIRERTEGWPKSSSGERPARWTTKGVGCQEAGATLQALRRAATYD